ncbi:MAG: hypothetical protein ACRCUM_03860 [Mycoplasmoidaceae bacterium]
MKKKFLDELHLCFADDEVKWNLAWLIKDYEKMRETANEKELIELVNKYDKIIWEWHQNYFTRRQIIGPWKDEED